MLQFLGTSYNDTGPGTTCQIYQLIDVGAFADLIAAGQAIASASAYFNRVAGDAQTDTRFDVGILAYSGAPSSFPSIKGSPLAFASNPLYTDGAPSTWERTEAQLILPTNTDFIAVGVYVGEDIYDDISAPEFDGHFADSVSVEIVPEPMTLLLLGLGTVMLRRRR